MSDQRFVDYHATASCGCYWTAAWSGWVSLVLCNSHRELVRPHVEADDANAAMDALRTDTNGGDA